MAAGRGNFALGGLSAESRIPGPAVCIALPGTQVACGVGIFNHQSDCFNALYIDHFVGNIGVGVDFLNIITIFQVVHQTDHLFCLFAF